jgi:hypothetical protein
LCPEANQPIQVLEMESEGTYEGGEAVSGTLTGKAPAARIFALVILSLAVLLGSLLAVSAIGRSSDDGRSVKATPAAVGSARGDDHGVLVVPKDEPVVKAKPKPKAKPVVKAKPKAKKVTPTPKVEAASSSATPATSSVAPQTRSSTPAPVQQATPAPAPTPAPKPVVKPTPKPAAKQPAPVRHTVVVTE